MADNRGIYNKFSVHRNDGNGRHPGDRHFMCRYFVLDVTHDPLAPAALLAYAEAAEEAGNMALASDLHDLVDSEGDGRG